MNFVQKGDQAIVTHGKERLIFDLSEVTKNPHRSISRDPFRELNLWLDTLTEAKQAAIFDVYKSFREELTVNTYIEHLMERMGSLAEVLYKYIKHDEIREFIESNRLLTIPKEGFVSEHEVNDPSPEKTYTAPEYHELMIAIVCLRALYPVCPELMARLTKTYGKDHKEHFARISLITDTWLATSPQFKRLRAYIETSVSGKKDQISNIVFNAMSKEDFPEWAMSKIICRRLLSGEVRILPGVPNQIASIYSFIENSVRQTPKIPGAGEVVLKKPLGEGGDDHKSSADEIRVRQNTTVGYLVRHETYFQDVGKIVLQIDPTVPVELIEGAKRNPLSYGINALSRWHTVISQIIIADKVSVRILEALSKPVHLAAAEVARILLWHWGHKELSLLISAEDQPLVVERGEVLMLSASSRMIGDADDELIEKINQIYVLEETRRTKSKLHPVYLGMKELANLIQNRFWDVRPIDGVELPDYVDSSMKMRTPTDIVNLVVKFQLELAEKRLKMEI